MDDKADYTIADLEKAEADHLHGDSGRHSNPGRTRRNGLSSLDTLIMIRKQLIERGVIDGSRPFGGPRRPA